MSAEPSQDCYQNAGHESGMSSLLSLRNSQCEEGDKVTLFQFRLWIRGTCDVRGPLEDKVTGLIRVKRRQSCYQLWCSSFKGRRAADELERRSATITPTYIDRRTLITVEAYSCGLFGQGEPFWRYIIGSLVAGDICNVELTRLKAVSVILRTYRLAVSALTHPSEKSPASLLKYPPTVSGLSTFHTSPTTPRQTFRLNVELPPVVW